MALLLAETGFSDLIGTGLDAYLFSLVTHLIPALAGVQAHHSFKVHPKQAAGDAIAMNARWQAMIARHEVLLGEMYGIDGGNR